MFLLMLEGHLSLKDAEQAGEDAGQAGEPAEQLGQEGHSHNGIWGQ